jgi:hypothetical protein
MIPGDTAPAEDVTLFRWFLVLPEPLPLPDGWVVTEPVPNTAVTPPEWDDPAVSLRVHQVTSKAGRASGAVDAIRQVVQRDAALPSMERSAPRKGAGITSHYTLIEAITTAESPDPPPHGWSGDVADLPARSDSFMRCLRLLDDIARAYRIASAAPYGLPSYERIMSPVIRFSAQAVRQRVSDHEQVVRSTGPWRGPQAIFLNHSNVADVAAGPPVEGDLSETFSFWIGALRSGHPLATWRDQVALAKRALDSEGDYAQAVVLANSACELLIDAILAMLLWEEEVPVEEAALLFGEGEVVRRVKQELPKRLKGNWALSGNAPVGRWFTSVYRLRHRVVHGGYRPSRQEAGEGVGAMRDLERFVFDRLAARRYSYPKVTLLTIAEPGLRKRGIWAGKIKLLAESNVGSASALRSSFRTYFEGLVAARTPRS